jgi:hypothetical protein
MQIQLEEYKTAIGEIITDVTELNRNVISARRQFENTVQNLRGKYTGTKAKLEKKMQSDWPKITVDSSVTQ